jgi:putative oxidoreductase|tara:strand:- start:4266 stop:4697 length:432 start_codon:yes stop_codon:yes gene_type:complete
MKLLPRIVYLALGATFIWAGVAKLIDPSAFLSSILTYEVFGYTFAVAASLFMPYLELCVGFSLATGFLRGGARWLAGGMTVVFLLLLIQAAVRGLDVDCGCFGSEAKASETGFLWPISRDVVMLAALFVAVICERCGRRKSEL